MSGDRLSSDLANLEQLEVAELVSVWDRHLTQRAPDHLPRSLLVRLLAYRLQVQLHGGLSKRSLAYLKSIVADLAGGRMVEVPFIAQKQITSGTQLVREYDGALHRVMVLEGSLAWDGKTYASLSAVAKAITGTNWNGHRFFGLKEGKRAAIEATS